MSPLGHTVLLCAGLIIPHQALAANCPQGVPPAPIVVVAGTAITCINTAHRSDAGNTIDLSTSGIGSFISLFNSGSLSAGATGIRSATSGLFAPITIVNFGPILAGGIGISASAALSGISLQNHGPIAAAGLGTFGISTLTGIGDISLRNSGDIVTAALGTFGISAVTGTGKVSLNNSGDIAVGGAGVFGLSGVTAIGDLSLRNSGDIAAAGAGVFGISAASGIGNLTLHNNGHIAVAGAGVFGISAVTGIGDLTLQNSGDIAAAGAGVFGISALTGGADSTIDLQNSGDIASGGTGVFAETNGGHSALSFVNSGHVTGNDVGLMAETNTGFSPLTFTNSGGVKAGSTGIFVQTNNGSSSAITFNNSGAVTAAATGIFVQTNNGSSPIAFSNSGAVTAVAAGIFVQSNNGVAPITFNNSGAVATTGNAATAIDAESSGGASPLSLVNAGHLTTVGSNSHGIFAQTDGPGSPLSIINNGAIRTFAASSSGIQAAAASDSTVLIKNSGSVIGGLNGIAATSVAGTSIDNSGSIAADSLLAISVASGGAHITNSGTITGFVQLDASDTFVNQSRGTFEARLTSDFGPDSDLFENDGGATVHTANNPQVSETTTFVNLERFENQGLISLVDGHEGDVFHIANAIGGITLDYVASNNASLAVDAYLGGPGSKADNFIIDGNVSGKTLLVVNNTSTSGGAPNSVGIPVVFVNTPVSKSAFYLKKPIDAGYYSYDLFLDPGSPNVFVLRSGIGGGSFVLPQLTTAAQDIFFSTSETWFDRTADLRVLLNGGTPSEPVDDGRAYIGQDPRYESGAFTPAVWVRGSGTWLSQDDSAGATSNGRSYQFALNRDLQVTDAEMGIDFGKRDLLGPGDILVFGALGGFVDANLDYKSIEREFDFRGAEVGAYTTYLNGGLFVDSLFKADLLTLDPREVSGFPDTLESNSFGFRVDSGYRFGDFRGGLFLEPLATIAAVWSNIDSFTEGNNSVRFEGDAGVRGRVGLRFGSRTEVWTGTFMEPFVIGSLWGTLSGDNGARLTSFGTTYPTFSDDVQNAWGVVSTGLNFFNSGAHTSVFAKLDVSFGEDLTGVGGKAGMRVSW